MEEAFAGRDWERAAADFAPEFTMLDRRSVVRLDLDREQHLQSLRAMFDMATTLTDHVLATRGDRLALARARWEGAARSIGPSEAEWLLVIEMNDRGKRVAIVNFDPDDVDAAYAELDARYAAGEAAAYERVSAAMQRFRRAFADRDWDTLTAQLAPDLFVDDHRLLGWEPLQGAAAYVDALRSMVELAPDVRFRLDHVEICARGYLVLTTWVGTREGGAFEAPSLIVGELDGSNRVRRFDQYDVEHLEEARRRFAAIDGVARPDPLHIPPNAATRASQRLHELAERGDWDALRALCAPIVLDDRRRLVRLSGDCHTVVANAQMIGPLSAVTHTVLATAGDRLALERNVFTRRGAGGAFEVVTLQLIEVDADGRVTAAVIFDPDQRAAASKEFRERSLRNGPPVVKGGAELIDAMNEHDLARCRAALGPDFVFHDHRRTGVGRLESADEYIASLAALMERAPDVVFETLYNLASAPHADVAMAHMFGTLVDGGEFESPYVRLAVFKGNRLVGTELFEPEDIDLALARFEALRPRKGSSRARGRAPNRRSRKAKI
jgi:hypothetical protein